MLKPKELSIFLVDEDSLDNLKGGDLSYCNPRNRAPSKENAPRSLEAL